MIRTTGRGQETQILGQALSDVGNQLYRTNLIVEKTRAQNHLDSSLLDIQGRSAEDQDLSVKKQKFYDEQIRQVKKDSAKMISVPMERSLFEQQSSIKADVARIKVKGDFTKKIIEQGKIDLETYLTNKEDEFINAKSIGDKQTSILERDTKIQEAVEAGYLTKKEAAKQIKKLNKDWAARQVDHDISVNPALARENIVAGNYDLSAKEEKEALTLAKNLEARRKDEAILAQEEAMIQGEIEIYNGVIDGSKSLREINDAEARGRLGLPGGIREGVASDLRRLITKGDTATDAQKADSFVGLQDRFTDLEEDDIKGMLQFKADVIGAMSNGTIRHTVGEKWIKAVSGTLEEKNGGWETIKFWIDTIFTPEKQMLREKMGRKLLEGEGGVKEAKKIIEEEKKVQNPQWNNLKEGDIINSPDGRTGKIVGFLPNGEPDIEEIK